jgi:hypothetical protein
LLALAAAELEADAGTNAIVEKSMTPDEFSAYMVNELKLIKDEKEPKSRSVRVYALRKAMAAASEAMSAVQSAIGASAEVSAFSIPVKAFMSSDQHAWEKEMQMKPGQSPAHGASFTNAFSNGTPKILPPRTNGPASEIKGATQPSGDSQFVENLSAAAQKLAPPSGGAMSGGGSVKPSGQALANAIAKSDDLNDSLPPSNKPKGSALERMGATSGIRAVK